MRGDWDPDLYIQRYEDAVAYLDNIDSLDLVGFVANYLAAKSCSEDKPGIHHVLGEMVLEANQFMEWDTPIGSDVYADPAKYIKGGG